MPNSLRALVDNAYTSGKNWTTNIRKVPAIAAVTTTWVDLSMAPGTPRPNYYVGDELTFTVPTEWYKKGIWHGGSVSPDKKFLHKIALLGTTAVYSPAMFTLCDYLGYYPLVDMDSTDTQLFINYGPIVTPITDPLVPTLPRYTDGEGVRAFLVATNPYVGGAYFQINYTNSDGVDGRISHIQICNTATYIGTLVNSVAPAAGGLTHSVFIPLQGKDIGIRSVQSIKFESPNGGLAALVLVKPIANIATRGIDSWVEIDYIKDRPSMPVIEDGAYLNFLVNPTGTVLNIPLLAELTFAWGA